MRVATLVSPDIVGRLQSTLDAAYDLAAFDAVCDLVTAIRRAPYGAILVDTAFLQRREPASTISRFTSQWSPLIIVASRDLGMLSQSDGAGWLASSHLVAADAPDLNSRVHSYLESQRRDNLRDATLSTLAPRLARLPRVLNDAARALIEYGRVPSSAADFAHQVDVPLRSIDRALTRADLGSMRRLTAVARAIRAHELLQLPDLTLTRVAAHAGFASVRPLRVVVYHAMRTRIETLREPTDITRLLDAMSKYLARQRS
jgi:hypothetical protein